MAKTIHGNEDWRSLSATPCGQGLGTFKSDTTKRKKVNPEPIAYQIELAQVEAEIEKLLDTLIGANAILLAYAMKN